MSGDVGPDESTPSGVSTRQWPHLAAAAAVAEGRDDKQAAALLRESKIEEVHFAEPALREDEGVERIVLDVVLTHRGGDVGPSVRERAQASMNEAVSHEGYHVRSLTVRAPR